jgi:hypothetical protein
VALNHPVATSPVYVILEGYGVDVVLRFIGFGPPKTADCPLRRDIAADDRTHTG